MLTRRRFLASFRPRWSLCADRPGFLARTARGRRAATRTAASSSSSSSTAATTASTPSSPTPTGLRTAAAASCGWRPRSWSSSTTGSACTRRCGRPPSCSRPAGWRSCRGSATRTRTARTSRAWRSGRPPARPEESDSGTGWLGRGLDRRSGRRTGTDAVFVGTDGLPLRPVGRRAVAAIARCRRRRPAPCASPRGAGTGRPPTADGPADDDLRRFVRRSVARGLRRPPTGSRESAPRDRGRRRLPADARSADRLELIARLIKAGLGTRVYYTSRPATTPTPTSQRPRRTCSASSPARSRRSSTT